MAKCHYRQLLLWITASAAVNTLENYAKVVEDKEVQVKNLTSKSLQVIPHCEDSRSIAKLLVKENQITLNEEDQRALTTYPGLIEVHLDRNLVTAIAAEYFSIVPYLRVLSLSRNKISRLDPDAFSGLDVLTELDLSHNLLTVLPSQLFRGLNNLQVLNLRSNGLEVLDGTTIKDLGHLRLVDLQENPWNCSCLLLRSIGELKASGAAIVGTHTTCTSPERLAGHDLVDATSMCYPPPSTSTATDPPQAPVNTLQPWSSTNMSKVTTPSQNHIINRDQTPAAGNTWKFTACVTAIALSISMIIVCAVKGPSWHKLFFNYRHRRLREEENEEEEEEVDQIVFSNTGTSSLNHDLDTQRQYAHKQKNGRVEEEEEEEEEEDGYIEDPYIKRSDCHAGEGMGYSSITSADVSRSSL
ncbi:hypothetical protein LDENG_00107370 [Lucifuga dentata]|nr:hypothetical protein LDENG_00107370 [Lucifuga dentata]